MMVEKMAVRLDVLLVENWVVLMVGRLVEL
jgi:hypothetical protein